MIDPIVTAKSLKMYLEQCERDYIAATLHYCKWNRRRAARMLGIGYRTLFYKIDKYSL